MPRVGLWSYGGGWEAPPRGVTTSAHSRSRSAQLRRGRARGGISDACAQARRRGRGGGHLSCSQRLPVNLDAETHARERMWGGCRWTVADAAVSEFLGGSAGGPGPGSSGGRRIGRGVRCCSRVEPCGSCGVDSAVWVLASSFGFLISGTDWLLRAVA
jgi:hypothetical protein